MSFYWLLIPVFVAGLGFGAFIENRLFRAALRKLNRREEEVDDERIKDHEPGAA